MNGPPASIGFGKLRPLSEPTVSEPSASELAASELAVSEPAVSEPAALLMLQGGDARLDRSPETGLNRYGCGPWPEEGLIAFSSSTANPLTPLGLRAAEDLLGTLRAAAGAGRLAEALAQADQSLKTDIAAVIGLPAEAEIVPTASGTTACLIATHLAQAGFGPEPAEAGATLALLVGRAETGGGVPLAAAGRHPAGRTPLGMVVVEGGLVAGMGGDRLAVEDAPLRDGAGRPRDLQEMAAHVEARVAAAVAAGQRVILHAMEGSKTGLSAPGPEVVARLKRRFGERLAVIVDACQLRCDGATVRRHLEAGALVAVTGSKFLGGPAFSGALILPPGFPVSPQPLAPMPLAEGLAGYTRRGAWPASWAERAADLPDGVDQGQLLRWRAALAEAAPFASLPAAAAAAARRLFDEIVTDGLAKHPALRRLSPLEGGIVTFAVRRADGGDWCSMGELRDLYARLRRAGCLTGQPVALEAGAIGGALRVAASASHFHRLASGGASEVGAELAHLLATLEKLRASPEPAP